MPHCSLCSLCGSNYGRRSIAYQLIIRLSWCEASNNVDSFLLYSQAVRSAQVENGGFFFCDRGVGNEVKRTIGMKWASDGEGDSSESKKGAYEKIIYFITNIVYVYVI